jgi:serine phosphatase RsbU (regulator of sigma subunit)
MPLASVRLSFSQVSWMASSASLSASEIIRHIFAALDSFTAGTPQHDDMTLVALRAL